MKYACLSILAALVACHTDPAPSPIHLPDTAFCGDMCKHIGPKGLRCEEGDPLYDSDRPGPVNVPNMTCEEFCVLSQERGAFFNPRCVLKVKSCAEIEPARMKEPSSCL